MIRRLLGLDTVEVLPQPEPRTYRLSDADALYPMTDTGRHRCWQSVVADYELMRDWASPADTVGHLASEHPHGVIVRAWRRYHLAMRGIP